MIEKFALFVMRHRLPVLLLVLASTAVFGWKASQVEVKSLTIDLFPTDHEFVETFVEYQEVFGGASSVVMVLEVEDGTIFNTPTLKKLRRITKAIELLPAINNYQVLSLAQRKVRDIRVDEVEGFTSVPLMWPEVPETEEAIGELVATLKANPRYNGKLVSLDEKAALLVAGFFEEKLDYGALQEQLKELQAAEEDENTKIHFIGRPVLLGSILHQYPQLVYLFIATIVAMFLMLLLYFRDARGVLVPFTTAIISAIWGIGFLGFMDFNFDPLIIVIPFIISARALSHSVQLINRYLSEFQRHRDRQKAAAATMAGLMKPGLLAIITDAAGVLVVWLTPIPLMQKLALMGGFWVISIIVSDMIFNPVFLSYFPPPQRTDTGRGGITEAGLRWVGRVTTSSRVWTVLVITGVVFVVGFLFARNLVIGDVHPGSPMLWPDSEYNLSTDAIAKKFGNTEIFNVVVEGESRDAIKSPEVLRNMEGLQRELERVTEVSASMSIADLLPGIISAIHGGDPKWELIPLDRRESGFFLSMIFSAAEPGDLANFITQDSKNANISVYLRDHKGTTLAKLVRRARAYIASHPFPLERPEFAGFGWADRMMVKVWSDIQQARAAGVSRGYLGGAPGITADDVEASVDAYLGSLPFERAKFRLAGGYGGLLAAVNEVIIRTEALVTGLAFLIVFLFCAIAYRSVVAGLFFLVPLVISNYLTYGLMGALEIGLDVNSLPVVALGVGLGVDYGLYIVGRVEEEFRRNGGDLAEAIIESLSTAGKAVFFTAGTMIAGVAFWATSFLRFQADMGLLLVFWMMMSALGGLILLPTLIWLVKPKFLQRRAGFLVDEEQTSTPATPTTPATTEA